MRTRILFLNNEIIPGALRVNCAWYWKGSDEVLTKAHSHNGGEIIAFIGTNPDDPRPIFHFVASAKEDIHYIDQK